MKKPDVYVVIVTYNGMEWIDRCFGSLEASELPLKTIVVDNGSTDGTVDKLRRDYPSVEIIETGRNLGFGKGNNIAIKLAYERGCDYVYLLNQDAWIDPDTIGKMIEVQKAHPEYYVLSPIQMKVDKKTVEYCFELRCEEHNCPGYLADVERGEVGPVYEVGFIMAAHWLLPRESLRDIGGFAPVFHHFGEDDNYLHRVQYHGFKAGICPAAYGVHAIDESKRNYGREHYIKWPYMEALKFSCDINRGTFAAWLKGLWHVHKRAVKCVFKFRTLSPLFNLPKWYYRATPEIFRTQKLTRTPGAHYIS